MIWVNQTLGKPQLAPKIVSSKISQGIYFSIGQSAYNINSHIDKTMLASMASLEATGIYGAAYRLVEVGSIPIYSVLTACYPRFFQEGATGISGCLRLVKRLLPFAVIFSIFALIGF